MDSKEFNLDNCISTLNTILVVYQPTKHIHDEIVNIIEEIKGITKSIVYNKKVDIVGEMSKIANEIEMISEEDELDESRLILLQLYDSIIEKINELSKPKNTNMMISK